MAPEKTTDTKTAVRDEEAARKQDETDAIAEVKAEREGTDKASIEARVIAKAKARAEALSYRQREIGDVQPPNYPVAGDSDLEAALKALGAEVDRAGARLLDGVHPVHATAIAALAAFHPPRPNEPRVLADGKTATPANVWDGVSTEDRINYEVDRLAALRRALNPPIAPAAQWENTADAHRAATAALEARTPEQKKADAEAAQKVADAAAKNVVGPTKVKALAMFITDGGAKVSKGDTITLEGAELNRRITNGEVTKDLS